LRKDVTIATVAAAVILGVCYLLNVTRPPFKARASKPYALALSPGTAGNEKVVMRINGDPVTEAEFSEAFRQMPEDVQRQFASTTGKQAFAEQYIRLKLLAEEGERTGVTRDPHVKAQLAAGQTSLVAGATLQKIVQPPTEQAVQAFYKQHRGEFESVDLSHIVVAYQGGMLPPRKGGTPPGEQAATQKAVDLYMKVKNGADFAQVARDFSDDPASAANGGKLGPFTKGMLPPEIEAQVFRLQPGQLSGPMPSRYGIHLFMTGPRALQPLDRVRPLVTRQLQQQNAYDRVEILRKNAKVDFDPKFFPDAKTWNKNAAAPKAPPS